MSNIKLDQVLHKRVYSNNAVMCCLGLQLLGNVQGVMVLAGP